MSVSVEPGRAGGGQSDQARPPRRVLVLGAGITGLAAAHRVLELDPGAEVQVLESGPSPGGVLRSVRQDGFLIETSADSFITNVPWGLDLARRLGLEDRLIQTDARYRRAFVVRAGRLEPLPDGLLIMAPSRLWPMVTTRILSPAGKLRMAWERFVPKGPGTDESLAAFARRRFGREAYERLIQPLVGGMYTGDPERLSVRATMPRFLDMEQTHGSLIRAVRPGKGKSAPSPAGSGARYGLFVGFAGGFSELIDALVRRLPAGAIRCESPVERVQRLPAGTWQIDAAGPRPCRIEADAVIVATPVHAAGALLAGLDSAFAALGRIPATSCAVVSLGYPRDAVSHPLDGFGFVVPTVERRTILSGSFSSVKFEGRAPASHVLFRVFIGGSTRPELLDRDDADLVALAARELEALVGARGEPVVCHVARWRDAMPQYHLGHLERVAEVRSRLDGLPGLALAGNAYGGVGVPHCIRSGEEAAERVLTAPGVEQGS